MQVQNTQKKPTILQRWAIKRAWRKNAKKRNTVKSSQAKGYVFFLPPFTDQIAPYLEPLNGWLKDHLDAEVTIIMPKNSRDLLSLLEKPVKSVTFSPLDITRGNMPKRYFIDKVIRLKPKVVVLLQTDVVPFNDYLFASIRAEIKVAIWNEMRDNFVSLLVKPSKVTDPAHSTKILLDTLSTFIGNDSDEASN